MTTVNGEFTGWALVCIYDISRLNSHQQGRHIPSRLHKQEHT
ncbi:MAG: hypothetical protein V8Q42_09155 [Anaerovoracaceae bacterium]